MAKSSPALIVLSLLAALAVWADTTPPNIDKALQAQYQLVNQRPLDAMAHNDLGNLLSLTGRLAEAESAYLRAKDLDAADPSIRFNLGLLFQQAGRLDDANQEFYSLLELDPQNAWAYYQLGVVAFDQGKNKKATELYARSFAIDPTLSFPQHNPHIIDNDLATEALLMSSRYKTDSTARVPRHYAEAGRIADLMLEEEESAEEEMAEAETEAKEEGTEWDEPMDPSTELLDDGEEESSRVLTNEDLEDLSPVGQAEGRNTRRGTRSKGSSRYSSGRSGRSMGRDGSEEQDTRSRYRPRSSGGRNNSLGGSGYTTMGRAGEEGGTDELVEKSGGTNTLRPQVGQPRAGAPVNRPLAARPTPERPTSTRPITARPGSGRGGGGGRPFEPGTGSTASLRFELVDDQDAST